MELGKIYYFDNHKTHHVSNHSDEDRVHLVIDWKPNSSKVIKTFLNFMNFLIDNYMKPEHVKKFEESISYPEYTEEDKKEV